MDVNSPVFKLQLITLLDSVCYGLIYGFLSPYIIHLGANQMEVGILASGNLLCTLVSPYIANSYAQIYGKPYTLYMIFNAEIVTHVMMVLTNSYWFTIFSRYIFSLTNQSQNFCKDLLLKNTPQGEHELILIRHSILNGAGYIIGPFIAGCLFHLGFGYIGLLAAVLTLVNACLIMNIPLEQEIAESECDERTVVEKAQCNICDVIQELKNAEYEKNWDIIAMRYLYLCSVIIFSSKFTQLLVANYHSSPFDIGYTSSYMNGLNFAAAYFIESIKIKWLSNIPLPKVIEYGLISSLVFILIACYSPMHWLYMLACGPIFLCFTFINTSWKDLSTPRGNNALDKLGKTLGILASLTVPLLFGFLHHVIGYHATIFFSAVPLFICIYILKRYSYALFEEDKPKQD